jgi:hypothetical protein
VGQNGTLAISDLQGLDGVTISATSTGDLQLWTNTTSIHWYVYRYHMTYTLSYWRLVV